MSFRVILRYAAPYRRALFLNSMMMVAESALALTVPWLGGQLAQGFLASDLHNTGTVLLALLALLGVQALLKAGSYYISSRNADHILSDLRVKLYDHLQALPVGFYHQRKQGEILTLLT